MLGARSQSEGLSCRQVRRRRVAWLGADPSLPSWRFHIIRLGFLEALVILNLATAASAQALDAQRLFREGDSFGAPPFFNHPLSSVSSVIVRYRLASGPIQC